MKKKEREIIRSINKSLIMNIFRKNDEVSRADLSRITGLSLPTIMKITDDFVQKGLIVSVGKGVSNGGKPPVLLKLIPESRLFVGADFSGAMFKFIIMDLKGGILFERNCRKSSLEKKDTDIDTIVSYLDTAISDSGIDPRLLNGLGIGVPGIVDHKSGIIINSIDYGWSNLNLQEILERHFHMPVYIENSSKVMAVGEQWFSEMDECNNFALVTVGRGIGAAFIIDGKIYSGFNNQSGELGHMVVEPAGIQCKCGKIGCLETVASGKAIEKKAETAVMMGANTILRDMCECNTKMITAGMVFKAAETGDPVAKEIVNKAIDYLEIGIENLVDLMDFQRIVLTGYVVENNQYLLNRIQEKINYNRNHYFKVEKPVEICISSLGEEAAVIGAATIPLQNLIENGGE